MSRRGAGIIVVGAGATGAALALALVQDGWRVDLVEAAAPQPLPPGGDYDLRVVALAPDARALLQKLGVWAQLEQRAGPYRWMRVWEAVAPGEFTVDAAERGEAALGWIVENRRIQMALWQALQARAAQDSRLRIHCPARIASLEQGEDAVTVALDDGGTLRGRVLVAADGARSALRERLGIATRGRDYRQRGVVAHVATTRPHGHTAWQRFLPGGPLAFLPLADGRCSVVWSLPEADAGRVLELDDAAFRAELGAAFDFRLGPLTATTARAAFPLRLGLAERHVAGRAVLLGDAAHGVHPLAGQGMNLGFRDVSALAAVLADARERGSDPGAPHVLRRHERARRGETAIAARSFDLIERLWRPAFPPLAAARGAALALAGRVGPVRRALIDAAAGRL